MKMTFLKTICFAALCLELLGCTDKEAVAKLQITIDQKLPVGTRLEQVKRVLEDEKFNYNLVESNRTFYAMSPTFKDSFLTTEKLSLVIYLDESNRVKEVKANTVFTGP